MVQAAVNEALRSAQELAASKMGAATGGARPATGSAGLRAAPGSKLIGSRVRRASQPPDHRARAPARHRPAHRAAARLPHPARVRRGGARAGRRHPRGQGDRGPVRGLLQPRRRGHLPHLPGRAPRADHDLRGRGAERRDPDRAHQRVPRPLPRAGRRAVADRRRRPRGPAHRPSCSTRVDRATASARWWSPRTRPPPARPPRSTSPTCCASARPRWRSRGWPAACRWARTSSTPTRSRWAGRSRGRQAL